MTKTIWIRNRGKNFVVVRVIDGKQKQVGKFPNITLAKQYVSKFKVAEQMKKVVDQEYDFKSKFEEFAKIKLKVDKMRRLA